jgi:osmotically-inducible protein OsmY
MPGIGSPTIGSGLSAVMSVPAMSGVAANGEISVGVPAPTLLAAIAVRRGQPLGPSNDTEIEDFICDALDMLPGAADVEIRCENGRAILTGTVPHKRLKRDVGEIAWAIPSVNDVQNSVTVASRRRARSSSPTTRESEAPAMATPAGRRQS